MLVRQGVQVAERVAAMPRPAVPETRPVGHQQEDRGEGSIRTNPSITAMLSSSAQCRSSTTITTGPRRACAVSSARKQSMIER